MTLVFENARRDLVASVTLSAPPPRPPALRACRASQSLRCRVGRPNLTARPRRRRAIARRARKTPGHAAPPPPPRTLTSVAAPSSSRERSPPPPLPPPTGPSRTDSSDSPPRARLDSAKKTPSPLSTRSRPDDARRSNGSKTVRNDRRSVRGRASTSRLRRRRLRVDLLLSATLRLDPLERVLEPPMPPISSFRRVVFDVHPKPCRGEESQDGHGEHGEVFRDDGERGGNHQAQRGSRAQEKRGRASPGCGRAPPGVSAGVPPRLGRAPRSSAAARTGAGCRRARARCTSG